MRKKCLCVLHEIVDGKVLKKPEKCTKKGLIKSINELLIHGWDSEYVSGIDTTIRIWARDEFGNLDSFEIEPEVVLEILRFGEESDKIRKETRRRYRDFLKGKKIEGIQIIDAYRECCYGTEEICNFEEMLKEESL